MSPEDYSYLSFEADLTHMHDADDVDCDDVSSEVL